MRKCQLILLLVQELYLVYSLVTLTNLILLAWHRCKESLSLKLNITKHKLDEIYYKLIE